MRVRVKAKSSILTVTAFTGREYVQWEWRHVPAGCEEEARLHPYLEIERIQHDPDSSSATEQVNAQVEDSDVPPLSSPEIEIAEAGLQENDATACLAFTKAGKRCKRKAIMDGYCKLHGGK